MTSRTLPGSSPSQADGAPGPLPHSDSLSPVERGGGVMEWGGGLWSGEVLWSGEEVLGDVMEWGGGIV